jgi:hypothetical protein
MRARWYDPGTGQFLSVDPDLAETDQPYAYASDDPVNNSDPSGLYCKNDPYTNDCARPLPGPPCFAGNPQCGPLPAVHGPLSWANDLLQVLNVPDNKYNQEVLMSWMQAEGGWTNGTNNPLSSGDWYKGVNHPQPGNTTGVQDYPNVTAALEETTRNLITEPSYAPVLNAFSADIAPNSDPSADQGDGWNVVYAIVASPWGTVAQPFETIYTDVLNGTQTILSGQPSPFLTSAAETVFAIACPATRSGVIE